MSDEKLVFEPSKMPKVGYLRMPSNPKPQPGCVARSVELRSLIDYQGPMVVLDFDKEGELLGIEVVG